MLSGEHIDRSDAGTAMVLMMDVDGVLVRGRPKDGLHLFTDLEADLGLSPDLLREAFFKPHWEEVVTGRAPLVERLASVLARVRPGLAAEALIAYWFENDSRIDQEVLAAMATYRRRGLRIYLATNQEHLRASYLMTEMGLGAHVDGIIYSAEIGHRKPSPDFYQIAAERAGAPAAQIMLVDDTLANVEAARQCGWRADHWTGDGDLRSALSPYIGNDLSAPSSG